MCRKRVLLFVYCTVNILASGSGVTVTGDHLAGCVELAVRGERVNYNHPFLFLMASHDHGCCEWVLKKKRACRAYTMGRTNVGWVQTPG